MKGWIKGMLIAAAACIGAGSLLCACALAMGARFSCDWGDGYPFVEMMSGDEMARREAATTGGELAGDEAAREEAARAERAGGGSAAEGTAGAGMAGGGSASAGTVGAGTAGDGFVAQEPPVSVSEEEAAAMEAYEVSAAEGSLAAPEGAKRQAMSRGSVVREIKIEVMGGLVEVVADDSTDQVAVVSSNEDYQCRQELEGDELRISVSLYGGFWKDWLGGRSAADFNWNDDLAAQIRIPAGVSFRKMDLDVRGGILAANRVDAQELDLNVEIGSLNVSGANVLELDGECKAGELIYQGQVGAQMDADCKAGRIQYLIDGSREDFWYEVAASAGSIAIDGKEEGVLGWEKRVIDNPGAVKESKLECQTGAIEVEFQ